MQSALDDVDDEIYITAYWEGYTEEGHAFPLNEIPDNVQYIPIAFIQPVKSSSTCSLADTWAFDDQFVYSKQQIRAWIAEINARGTKQKVLLSILDTPTTHWYPDVDIEQFAKSIAADCDSWGIAGIDVDAESGMQDPETQYVATFVELIKTLRKYLSADKLISYTCYTGSSFDTQIIGACRDDIDYINTMSYWGNFDAQLAEYNHYVNDIGDGNKVGIGVKAGNGGDSTSLDCVKQCAQFFRDNKNVSQKRMMLWSLTRDIKQITGCDDRTYLNTIVENISECTTCIALDEHIWRNFRWFADDQAVDAATQQKVALNVMKYIGNVPSVENEGEEQVKDDIDVEWVMVREQDICHHADHNTPQLIKCTIL